MNDFMYSKNILLVYRWELAVMSTNNSITRPLNSNGWSVAECAFICDFISYWFSLTWNLHSTLLATPATKKPPYCPGEGTSSCMLRISSFVTLNNLSSFLRFANGDEQNYDSPKTCKVLVFWKSTWKRLKNSSLAENGRNWF